ncbi:ribbon-helix-helix domain-containing protein [Sphingomonas quercus]|uniref:Ribbon-helix-helix domain-containing protein n=1 Tax=Sphingomonas quercus TaxID=2842451 RepID=A0ABS6BHQ6_9SPHN|nr:ribbon-helix-helix domain-containing protein [Sphingomonas quercus]MBU3077836.1 ribbon-helix-helix domain-containing protein [Sphingomonas quercus]
MGELSRWSLKVSRDTDIALRTLLASRGGRKGDLSRFVEEAVNREILRETIHEVRARNKDLGPAQIESLVDEALSEMAPGFWAGRRV